MALYFYKAVDNDGNQKDGTITAINIDIAINSLQRRGLIIADIRSEEEGSNVLGKRLAFLERVSTKELVILTRQFSTLFEAQVSALRIFKLMSAETQNPKLARTLSDIAESLQGGLNISASIEKHPDVFNSFYVSMVKSGEETGKLDETFTYLADYLDRNYEVTSKARNALVYPAFIVVTFVSVMILMFTVVIPKITGIILESGQEVPIYTKVVIGFSNILINYGYWILGILVVSIYLIYRYSKTPEGKTYIDSIKISIPYLGSLYKKLFLSRLADNLDTMLGSGIPMIKALELTKTVVDNEVYLQAIDDSIENVKGGLSLSDSFSKHPEFPSILIALIKVGEETGSLGKILGTLAKFYRREVMNAVDTLVGLIEPIMILLLAGGVGFLLASVLIPIYNVSSGF